MDVFWNIDGICQPKWSSDFNIQCDASVKFELWSDLKFIGNSAIKAVFPGSECNKLQDTISFAQYLSNTEPSVYFIYGFFFEWMNAMLTCEFQRCFIVLTLSEAGAGA